MNGIEAAGSQLVAVVTGGTQGIGAAISRYLLSDGISVVAVYRENDTAAQQFLNQADARDKCMVVKANVSTELGAKKVINLCRERFGSAPDILINNAGVQPRISDFELLDIEEWERALAGNLWATIHCSRLVVPNMKRRGFGRIVNISSVAATDGYVGGAQYSTAKAALSGLTVSLAREVARNGVTVNCILPCISRTQALESLPEVEIDKFAALIPTGRINEPEDVASAVLFLCSRAARQVTGQMLRLSGGR